MDRESNVALKQLAKMSEVALGLAQRMVEAIPEGNEEHAKRLAHEGANALYDQAALLPEHLTDGQRAYLMVAAATLLCHAVCESYVEIVEAGGRKDAEKVENLIRDIMKGEDE